MVKFPCKGCENRNYPVCFSTCEAYLKAKKEQDEINEKRKVEYTFRSMSFQKYERLTTVKCPNSYLSVNRRNKKSA